MSITSKLIKKFIIQFVLVLFIITTALIIGLVMFAIDWSEADMKVDFSKTSSEYLESLVSIDSNGEISIKDNAVQSIREQQGWFCIVNENKEILYSIDLPPDIKELIEHKPLSYFSSNPQIPQQIKFWSIPVNEKSETFIFGRENLSAEILNNVLKDVDWDTLRISEGILASSKLADVDLIFLDSDNKVIKSFPDKANANVEVSQSGVLFSGVEPWNYKNISSSYYHEETGTTLVVSTPNEYYHPDNSNMPGNKAIIKNVIIVFSGLLCILILLSFLLAKNFGLPILHIMKWLENLSNNDFSEPLSKKGRPLSQDSKGDLKKAYKIFAEVIGALRALTVSLQDNVDQIKKINNTREEWITGLSHDLKTPLSTLYGYSIMLESDQYDWSQDDVRNMASTMRNKADYMSGLIEDFNLTYRLKNDAVPIDKEEVEVNSEVNKIIEDFKENVISEGYHIHFHSEQKEIKYPISKIWFKRILDNLLANSIKHNPSGTQIIVEVQGMSQSSFHLIIRDNGVGMDKGTVENLFNRYYRGTNTEEFNTGTGLGLAITKELVLRHGGEIFVESDIGVGTKITIIFERE